MKQVTIFSLLLAAALLFAPPRVNAETYTYKDANGTVSYVDDLGKVPAKYRSRATLLGEMEPISTIDSDASSSGSRKDRRQQARGASQEKKQFEGTIELYVTDWCPVCKDAEVYIKQKGYSYVKYNIEKDKDAKKRNDGFPGRGVPLVIVGTNNFRGFSPDTLEYYLRK